MVRTTLIVALAAMVCSAELPRDQAHSRTGMFRGVNWADPRDNFVPDDLVLSGLDTSDTYSAANQSAPTRGSTGV